MSMSNHDRILPDKVADTTIDVPHPERAAVYNIIIKINNRRHNSH